ncbi:MAG: helix-turn-helix transcriptional regulator [Fimbriimonadaceae bacterium]|nr:helix-turn-helix transcriptional regulator [Fimbriimonadaceae bacterium]
MGKLDVRGIREDFEMTREEFAELLCLSSYNAVMNIENGYRNPSKFTIRFLRYLSSLPRARALILIEELKKHEPK